MNTPRTDAFEKQRIVEAATNDIATEAWADFARQLERELNSAKKEVSDWVFNANELQKGYNKLDSNAQELKRELKEAKSEQENVINGITYDLTVKCDSLRRQNERLREALKIAINTVECDSLDKDGHELPWHKIARKALAAQPEEKTK